MKPSQMPLTIDVPRRKQEDADADHQQARRPGRAGRRSGSRERGRPVTHQAIARAIRPPSSGKPGIRLKTSSVALTKARKPSTASDLVARRSVAAARSRGRCRCRRSARRPEAGEGDHQRHQRARRRHAELDARRSRCRAPSWPRRRTATGRCPAMPIPLRIATTACPSSCRSTLDEEQQRARSRPARTTWCPRPGTGRRSRRTATR